MNKQSTLTTPTTSTERTEKSLVLHNIGVGHGGEWTDFPDSDDYIQKVAQLLVDAGAIRVPPHSEWDPVENLIYRDLALTEITLAVGDHTGDDDTFIVEIGALLAFGEELPDSDSPAKSLIVLDQLVETLRERVPAPAFLEVSDQGDYNAWMILPLTVSDIDSDAIGTTLADFLNTATELTATLRDR